jgi:ribulose kinase
LRDKAKAESTTAYALLNHRLTELAKGTEFPAELTRELHVLPYHHGNRSPRADPTLTGMVSGLRLSDSVDQLALLYLATIQAIAHGTRHIIDTLNAHGYCVRTLGVTGGDSKNPVFLREHADITGCTILLPETQDAVLLGSAMLGATASGSYSSLPEAMANMSRVKTRILPAACNVREYHESKHRVFLRMYEDQMAYRALMGE